MSEKILHDNHQILDIINGRSGVTKTKITMSDHDTGKILGEFENKILVPGAQSTACKQFGLNPVVNFPTYNTELGLQNSLPPYPQTQPENSPITCLFCVGRSGATSTPSEVFAVSNTDRIHPGLNNVGVLNEYNDILPFRYVPKDADINEDLRQVYFGRKIFDNDMIGYFFKAFDTEPQLHIRYLDGTEVTANMYNITSSQQVEVYVEMRLSISKVDFRDYFDQVLGWDRANVSTISLLTAWYVDNIPEDENAVEKVYYRYYQDVLPFSKYNFGQEPLTDLNRAIDFNYQVYY